MLFMERMCFMRFLQLRHFGMGLILFMGLANRSDGFGSKPTSPVPPSCGVPGSQVFTTPNPVRKVRLKSLSSQAFHLPNGQSIDFASDINLIFQSAVTAGAAFAPTDQSTSEDCGFWIEIRGGVSTFVLNAFEAGLSFGYSPSGEAGNSTTHITGKTKVRVGTISMDFSIWECTSKGCASVAATTASSFSTGFDLTADIDFSEVNTSSSFVYQTPVGQVLRNIMTDAMKEISSSPRLSELSWSAHVKEVSASQGTLVIDAGSRAHLLPNQSFTVYASQEQEDTCSLYQAVANAHTLDVEPVSSTLQIDRMIGSRGVKVGDAVMVRPSENGSRIAK